MAAKVLLVEDDNNLREIYEARLMAEGYAIVTAKDGEEALAVAKAETPNLIISDVMMPRISGFEMLDILRNTDTLRDTKVIMLTALGQADDKTRANSLGADRYLVKSQVTLEDIVKAAHELLEGAAAAAPAAGAVQPAAASAVPTSGPVSVATAPPSPPPTPTATTPIASVAPAPASPMPAPSLSVQPEPVAAPAASVAPVSNPVAAPQSPSPAFNPTLGAAPVSPTVPADPGLAMAPAPAAPVTPASISSAPALATPPVEAPAPALNTAATTSEEQAAVGAQIDNFVRAAQPATEVDPSATTAANAAQDDAVLASAVHDLAANAEEQASEPVPAVATPTVAAPAPVPESLLPTTPLNPPAAPTAITDNVATTSRKIIQPISNPEPKVSIHELLAREEANSANSAPAATVMPNIPLPQVPSTPQTAGPVITGSAPTVPQGMAPQPAPMPPTTRNDIDPNNIAI